MSGAAELITAMVGGFATLGVGGKFVWNKIESRFNRIETELAKCRENERRSLQRRAVQIAVIEILRSALERVAPDSPELKNASVMLKDLRLKVMADQVDDANVEDSRP